MHFLIMDLGEDEIVLGYPWLASFQPCINWKNATLDEEEQPLVIRTLDVMEQRVNTYYTVMTNVSK